MRPTVTLDTRQADAVLREYARHNRRDWPDIVNAKSLDFAFRALAETPKANVEEIRALESREWWPKYVAKRIVGGGVRFRKGKAKINIQGKGFSEAEAREVSRKIIAARSRAIAFVKSGWLPAIRRLWPLVKDKVFARGSVSGAKQYGADKGSVRPAVPGDNPAAVLVNSAQGIEKVGPAAAQRALDGVAADMAVYIARKMEERARRIAR
jgi:hypothetical protein